MKELDAIIREIQVTEKVTALSEKQNKYALRVDPRANKIEIKRAVERMFKVRVTKVNTMNYAGKKKRERAMKYGRRSDWKRALVTLKPGDKIDITA